MRKPMFFAGIVTCLFCSLIQAQSQSARPDERLWSSPRSDPFAGVKSTVTVPLNVEPLPASAPWVVRTHFGSIMITPNVRIHPNPSTTQSEMSIAIHPVDKNVLLAGSNAVHTTVSAGSQGWYYSTNGGAIWSGRDTLPTHMNLLDMLSDPAVGIDMDGRLFFHALTISVNAFVARSTNNGVNWMQVVVPGSNSNSDKNHLAVDVSPGSPYQNNVYTAFTDFTSSPSPIVFSRSTNHGVTFSSAVTISGSIGSQFAQGVNLAVGPNGESYAAWSGYDSWPPPVATRLGFNKSTDGGANWGVARSIGTVNDLRGELNKGGNFIRVSSFPSLAVDRGTGARSGWMYIVYPEKNPVTPDIFMIRSTDSGITWSVPRRVNTDASGKDQWYPWVSVDPTTGLLAVVYYDSRNFANNDSAQVYVSVSLDGGDSFEDILVSDQPFLPRPISGLAGGYMGDYIGVVALHGSIFPCWNDNRTGIQQAYSARLDLIEVGSPRRISVSPDSLVFGNVFIASAETLGVTLRNIGFPDTLTVSHITSDQGEFVPLETGLTIPGGQARTVPVVFSPVTPPGVKSGTLTIASNDSVQPVVTIPMDGVGNYPPHLTVTPDSLRFVVNEGDSTTSTLTIGNTGLGPLTFSISNTYRRGSARVFGSSRLVPSPMFGTTLNQPRNENSIRHEMKSDLPVSSRPVEGERHRLLSDSTIRIVVVNFGDATAPLLDSLGLAYTLVDPVTFSTVDLTNYDVILLGSVFSWTSLQPINDRQSDIASFINNGGSVVALTQSTTNAWQWLPFPVTGSPVSGDYVHISAPTHPVMDSLTDAGLSLWMQGYHNVFVSFPSLFSTLAVAVDAANQPLVLAGEYGGGRIVVSGMHNEHGVYQYLPEAIRMMRNMVHWAAGFGAWLSEYPADGMVPRGGNMTIHVSARSGDLVGGTYDATIHVTGNDPLTPEGEVRASLRVIGAPNLVTGTDTLDFGEAYLGTPDTLSLLLKNSGSDTLRVTNILSSNPVFSPMGSVAFSIPPRQSRLEIVQFLPASIGSHTGNLSISSNDPGTPIVIVRLLGLGIHPPVIGVAPDSLGFTVNEGDSATTTLTISNTGLGVLHWRITNENVGALSEARRKEKIEVGLAAKAISSAGSIQATRHILAWNPYSDRSIGGEYQNTITAIRQYFSDFSLDTSTTIDPAVLASQLVGKDVFLVPEQELITDLTSVGTSFIPALTSFVNAGNTMIVMDYGMMGATTLLNGTGLMDISIYSTYGSATAVVFDTTNPLVLNVPRAFTSMNGTNSHTTSTGRKIVVEQSSGMNIVTLRDVGHGNVIYIGMDFYSYNSDMARLLSNAVQYGAGGNWLQEAPTSGTVGSGGSQTVQVKAVSASLDGGTYRADILVNSDDPVRPRISVPVRFTVIGTPNLILSRDTLDFGETFINYSDTLSLDMSNNGSDTLRVTGMTSSNQVFSVLTPTMVTIPPREAQAVKVRFIPPGSGLQTGTLGIASNDPGDPITNVFLRGTGIYPPHITVIPDSFAFTVNEGDSSSSTMTIGNTGLGTLEWQASTIGGSGAVNKLYMLPPAVVKSHPPDLEGAQSGDMARTKNSRGQVVTGPLTVSLNDLTGRRIGITNAYYYNTIVSDLVARGASVTEVSFPLSPGGLDSLQVLAIDDALSSASPSDISLIRTWMQGQKALLLQGDDASSIINLNLLLDGSGISEVSLTSYYTAFLTHIVPHSTTVGVDTVYAESYGSYCVVAPPAQTVVFDDASRPHAVVSSMGAARVVAVGNEFSEDYNISAGDTRRFANQVFDWLMGLNDFLSITPSSGVVQPGNDQNAMVKAKSGNLIGGTYPATIVINSNDPVNNPRSVPARLRVIGAPNIVFSPDSINFIPTFIGSPRTDTLMVRNTGSDTLIVINISSSDPVFQVSPASMHVAPFGERNVLVTFTPTSAGLFSSHLTVRSNDPTDSTIIVPLQGTGIHPPHITLSPDSLNFTVNEGDSTTGTLTIGNTGLGDLTFTIENEFLSFQRKPGATHSTSVAPPLLKVREASHPAVPYAQPKKQRSPGQQGDNGFPPAVKAQRRLLGGRLFGVAQNTISEIDLSTGQVIWSFATPIPTSDGATGLAFSGTRLYFVDTGISSMIYVLDASTGSVVTSYPTPAASIDGLAVMNNKLYAMNYSLFLIYELTPDSGRVLRTISPGVSIAGGIDAGNGRFFASNFSSMIFELDINSGAVINSFVPVADVYGLGFTGTRLFASEPSVGTLEYDPNTGEYLGMLSNLGFAGLAGGGGSDWLSENRTSGTVPPGGNIDISVKVRSTGLMGGTYPAIIHVQNDDPLRPVADAYVRCRVVGAPNIVASPESLIYPGTFVGYADTLMLGISNTGSDTLRVSGMTTSNQRFSVVGTTAFSVSPFGRWNVPIYFSPDAAGTQTGNLSIASNDPGDPTVFVGLAGVAVHPPQLTVTPDSLSFSTVSGDSATGILTIGNTGLGELRFSITTEVSLSDSGANSNRFFESSRREGEVLSSRARKSGGSGLLPGSPTEGNIVGVFKNGVDISQSATFSKRVSDLSRRARVLLVGDTTLIDFDDLSQPCLFINTVALRNEYSGSDVAFDGPSGNDGGGIVDQCGGFGVSGYSPPNFLAFNTGSSFSNGGVPRGPETIIFSTEVSMVQMKAGSSSDLGSPVTMEAFDTHGSSLGSSTVFLTPTMQSLQVSSPGIVRAVISTPAQVFVLDDLRFVHSAWLTVTPTIGTVPAGGSTNAVVKAKTNGLLCGATYHAIIHLVSNDPERRLNNTPVRLRVSGASHIMLSCDTLSFPESYVGFHDTLGVVVLNTGCDTLRITGVSAGDPQFGVVGASAFAVPRDSSRVLLVRFSPLSAGLHSSSLTINSNDSSSLVRNVVLKGVAYLPPAFSVNPDSITRSLNGGDSATAGLTIRNSGPGPLRFTITEGVGVGSRVEFFGDTTAGSTFGTGRMLGNIYSVNTPTVLKEIKSYLSITTSMEIRFLVYQSATAGGPFNLINETVVGSPGTGTRFYSSGFISVPLAAGPYYYIAVAYSGSPTVYRKSATLPVPTTFGHLEFSGFVSQYPPSGTVTPLRSSVVVWTQAITTGYDLVTSIQPDSAAVDPGDSISVLARLKAPNTAGIYSGTLDIRTNDPLHRSAGILVLLDVLTGVDPLLSDLPVEFALHQNYPNPFNPTTTIVYDVPRESHVRLSMYNLLGQEVARLVDTQVRPGRYRAQWQAKAYASGVYFYRMEASAFTSVKKLIILK